MVYFRRFTHMRDHRTGHGDGSELGHLWQPSLVLEHRQPTSDLASPIHLNKIYHKTSHKIAAKDGEPLRKGVEMGVAIDFHCDLQRQHEVRHVGTHCLPRGFPWFPDVSSQPWKIRCFPGSKWQFTGGYPKLCMAIIPFFLSSRT